MRIESVTTRAWNVELLEPFGIATGTQLVAQNVLVEVRLEDGTVGLGEAAPFPAVNGETQAQVLNALNVAGQELAGRILERGEALWGLSQEMLAATPSALAALEMALLDADCRQRGTSMFQHFGAHSPELQSDITIPTGSPSHAASAAVRALEGGFRTLKVKVGGAAFEHDLARLRGIAAAAPTARLLLDANASLTAPAAIALVEALGAQRHQVVLFEQPCARGDFAGARAVREAGLRVAADECARHTDDVRTLHQERAADVINFKLTKCGLSETLSMIRVARELGFGLMIGGMVETRLAMTVSACIAGGSGGFAEVDLDTPLFMRDDRLAGGFDQNGPRLGLARLEPGHGVRLRSLSTLRAADAEP